MSSLFPLLRSLLFAPSHSHQEQRGASIQHIIQDRDRGGFTTPDRQQDHLSFHDTGLRGSQGALIVLEALATNPFASKLTLSHNSLGDPGVRQLATRIRFLKSRRTTCIHELNLASNALTDIALADLCRSWDGLAELYLSNNRITLASTPSPFLGLGNLTLLSLTANPIHSPSLSALLRNPNLAPLHLTTLHLSACSLDLSVAVSLALWLEDKSRSGNLEWLALNGNNWGTPGCDRIVWALARRGGNSNLLRVEMLACDLNHPSTAAIPVETPQDPQEDEHSIQPLPEEEHDQHAKLMGFKDMKDLEDCRLALELEGGWKKLLEKCESRNFALRLATRRAALGLVSSARHILISTPNEASSSTSSEAEKRSKEVFPWERLPEELKLHVWRWVSILSAFPGLSQQPTWGADVESPVSGGSVGRSTETRVEQTYELPDPLTPTQLLKVLHYAQDRDSLHSEMGRRDEALFNHLLAANALRHTPPSLHRQLVHNFRRDSDIDRRGKLHLLESCHCLRFQGSI